MDARPTPHTKSDMISFFSLYFSIYCPSRFEVDFMSIFTALHGMQTRSSDQNSVCLFVCLSLCPSVKRVLCDKMEETQIQIFISYERSFSPVFWEEEWLVGVTPSTWNFESTSPRWSEIADFQPIFACSASAVTPSKKVQLTQIESLLRSFQWAWDDHRTWPLRPKRGAQNAKRPISV